VSEHAHFGPGDVDALEVIDFLLLLKECEEIAEAKRKAWEK